MRNYFKPISISLSPNIQQDDVIVALKLLIQPWKWKRGEAIKVFEEEFKNYIGTKHAISFNSGRSSLYSILKNLNFKHGDEILLQAFTCNAVPNPILWADLNPVYLDCADDFNIDIQNLKQVIKKNKPRALIIQHTFGLPANMNEILEIAKENYLILIEDCAHALGAECNGKKVGTIGQIGFFSFSRDKVISSVYGGMVVTDDDVLAENLRKAQNNFGQPSNFWIFQQILHPILLWFFILPLYYFIDLGKLFLIFFQYSHILSKAVSREEKRGLRPHYFPKALPNALAIMALNQFQKLDQFNSHRKEIAKFYYQELKNTKFILPKEDGNIFLRFAVQHPKAHEIIYDAWHKENILLGDWYTTPIAPGDTKLNTMKYIMGSCLNAERLAKTTFNLPTHINISEKEAARIVHFLKAWK